MKLCLLMYKSKCPALSICIYAIMNVEWLFMIFIIRKRIFFYRHFSLHSSLILCYLPGHSSLLYF